MCSCPHSHTCSIHTNTCTHIPPHTQPQALTHLRVMQAFIHTTYSLMHTTPTHTILHIHTLTYKCTNINSHKLLPTYTHTRTHQTHICNYKHIHIYNSQLLTLNTHSTHTLTHTSCIAKPEAGRKDPGGQKGWLQRHQFTAMPNGEAALKMQQLPKTR